MNFNEMRYNIAKSFPVCLNLPFKLSKDYKKEAYIKIYWMFWRKEPASTGDNILQRSIPAIAIDEIIIKSEYNGYYIVDITNNQQLYMKEDTVPYHLLLYIVEDAMVIEAFRFIISNGSWILQERYI